MGTGWFFSRRDEGEIDIFWLRHESLEESDNLPDVLAQEIVVPRLASLGTTPSQGTRHALASVEGSKTSKLPSNNSAKSLLI